MRLKTKVFVLLLIFLVGIALAYVAWESWSVNPNLQTKSRTDLYQALAAAAGAATAFVTGIFGALNAFFEWQKTKNEALIAAHELEAKKIALGAKQEPADRE